MNIDSFAMSMAEGSPSFKMDVSLVFGSPKNREKILRTCFDSIDIWSLKYFGSINKSPFERRFDSITKNAAIIDNEVWVYGIDSTVSSDIVAAVKIAAEWYQTTPQAFIRNIYVKNLNAEGERIMSPNDLVQENKKLYTGVSKAIREAARILDYSGGIDFWVMSNNVNPKIPKKELHQALRDGGAKATAVAKRKFKYISGSNDGEDAQMLITNLHLGKLQV
ncbi:hypothetical protein [Microbulbifer sp. JMSA008]|uniref:hypothetical protein n=2 Tax=unclassified Microbulbifer TaxID=2619833 RepID=UPI004038FBEC